MFGLINWEIVRHPLNWLTIFAMVLIALVLLSILFPQAQSKGKSDNASS